MAEFEEKLNSILSDPVAMGQIMSIAQALSGDGQAAPPQTAPPPTQTPEGYSRVADPPHEQSADLTALTALLGGGGGDASPLAGLDPKLLQMAMRLFSEYNTADDNKTALLTALRPLLKEERGAKIDKAVQIAKLSRLIRVAFQLFRGGEPDV